MKVELISEDFEYNSEEKINKFISKENVSVIDIKYSTNCIRKEERIGNRKEERIGNTIRDVDIIKYTALIMYEDNK